MTQQDFIINTIIGTAAPLHRDHIDTDQLMPARYLTEITFDRMGDYLFYDLRYDASGQKTDFVLNQPSYNGVSFLIVGKNFGCGSSREHAPQALKRYGIRAVIGESFAEIFAGNCLALGIPVVTASYDAVTSLAHRASTTPDAQFTLDLQQKIVRVDNTVTPIHLDESRRQLFLSGHWDVVSLLLANADLTAAMVQRLPYIS